MKQVPSWGSRNIQYHHIQFSHPGLVYDCCTDMWDWTYTTAFQLSNKHWVTDLSSSQC